MAPSCIYVMRFRSGVAEGGLRDRTSHLRSSCHLDVGISKQIEIGTAMIQSPRVVATPDINLGRRLHVTDTADRLANPIPKVLIFRVQLVPSSIIRRRLRPTFRLFRIRIHLVCEYRLVRS